MVKNYLFLWQWFYRNYCFLCVLQKVSGSGLLFTEKNKNLPAITRKSAEIKWFDGVHNHKKLENDIDLHHVKSVRIRSYSGPYFPVFRLNTER